MDNSIEEKKNISELRQDLVSGDWVVIATGRGKRPQEFLHKNSTTTSQPKESCPFETLHKNAIIFYSSDGKNIPEEWQVQTVENKYPTFGKGGCEADKLRGPYYWKDGVGFHEVVVTRDHERPFALMSEAEIELVLRMYQERYLVLKEQPCIEYVSIFQNHGMLSGASILHPHSQITAIPVIPPDVNRSLTGSQEYFRIHGTCVHCNIIEYERTIKERIIYENEYIIVIAPFASKSAFEIRIMPKRHNAYFETTVLKERFALADALRVALAKLYHGLQNPDYIFFLHTSPVLHAEKFHNYHWHFEILPKTSIWAGFEIGTGIEISVIAPEKAALFLQEIIV